MPRFVFLAFAALCLCQRALEIVRHDGNVRGRRPHWTAIAITVVFIGFSVSSVLEAFLLPRSPNVWATVTGGAFFTIGFAIRRWVLRSLGSLWAIDIDLKPDHHLVRSGPYRFCRHPNYVAMLFEMVGFCLIPSAWYTLAIFLPLYLCVLAARIRNEESALLTRFGDEYRAYMRCTPAVLPWPPAKSRDLGRE